MGHPFLVDDLVLTGEGNSNVERLWRVRTGLGFGFFRSLTTSATSGTFRQIGNGHDNSRAKPLDSLGFPGRIMIGPCFALPGPHSSGDCHSRFVTAEMIFSLLLIAMEQNKHFSNEP